MFEDYVTYIFSLCLASFGFSLFVMDSPYLRPIKKWVRRRGWDTLYGGLNCPTCLGFWGGTAYSMFVYFICLSDLFTNLWVVCLCFLFSAFIGSCFSTLASFGIDRYLLWRDAYTERYGLDKQDPEDLPISDSLRVKREFLKLSIEERRAILEEQTKQLIENAEGEIDE